MSFMRIIAAVAALLLWCAPSLHAQEVPAPTATAGTIPGLTELASLPVEVDVAEGSLRLVNLYRVQARILLDEAGQPEERVVARLVEEVFTPYPEFWAGYLGDEAAFRRWAPALLDPDHPIHDRLPVLLALDLDRQFEDAVEWMESTTGRRPAGRWYILFGPGWTNMGGLGDGRMLADFSNMPPDSAQIAGLLPHELTHQVHKVAEVDDPDGGTVLYRILAEGLACYAAWVHAAGQRTPAWAVSFNERQWDWALEHEEALWEAAQSILASRDRADTDLVSHRGRQLIPGSPGAAGYFLGFRMVQAYVAAHGPDSWHEILEMPVAQVLARSGYTGR